VPDDDDEDEEPLSRTTTTTKAFLLELQNLAEQAQALASTGQFGWGHTARYERATLGL
jgi:hypothetical protein